MPNLDMAEILEKLAVVKRTVEIQRRYIRELEKQLDPEVIEEIKEELEHQLQQEAFDQ